MRRLLMSSCWCLQTLSLNLFWKAAKNAWGFCHDYRASCIQVSCGVWQCLAPQVSLLIWEQSSAVLPLLDWVQYSVYQLLLLSRIWALAVLPFRSLTVVNITFFNNKGGKVGQMILNMCSLKLLCRVHFFLEKLSLLFFLNLSHYFSSLSKALSLLLQNSTVCSGGDQTRPVVP